MHHVSSIGGGSYCLLNIIKALDRHQYDLVVAVKSEGLLVDELRRLNVGVVLFPQMTDVPYNRSLLSRGSIQSYLKAKSSQKYFSELLCKVKCDVLYLNNMMIYPYLRVAKKRGIKTIIHVREHWPLNEHKVQLGWARKAINLYADRLIAINQFSARMFPDINAAIVYDWIDMEARNQPILLEDLFGEKMEGKKVLLFTGGFSSIKGADYVLDSFVHGITGDEYRLLVLGVDDIPPLTGWIHKIKTLLETFGYYYYDKKLRELLTIDGRIKCVPAIYGLSDIIKQSHCFVSYFRIPHANLALAENIILGNPCIVADTEESREYSDNGRYAKLVSPMRNQKEFTTQLIDFLNHIDIWQHAANEGKMDVREKFCPEKNIAKLNAVLLSLLAEV